MFASKLKTRHSVRGIPRFFESSQFIPVLLFDTSYLLIQGSIHLVYSKYRLYDSALEISYNGYGIEWIGIGKYILLKI